MIFQLFFSHYFDTNTGHKRETDTYSVIANEISLPPNRILFLSDVVEELEAAEKAGLQTIQIKEKEMLNLGNNLYQIFLKLSSYKF